MFLGREALYYGTRALVVTGETPWKQFGSRVSGNLNEAGISFLTHHFTGYCSETNISVIAEEAVLHGADLIIGIGGGRCLDTAKLVANKVGKRCITVPTSCATCAAYAPLCVLYDDTGSALESVFIEQEVAAVIVDTEIITRECPSRMFASGMADALAKFPEMNFSMLHATDLERSVLSVLGLQVSTFNKEKYYMDGLHALADVRQGKISAEVENTICNNIALTGLTSCLAGGGKQLAIAHSIYNCVTTIFKSQRARFLHGEIVSCGIAVQMGTNGCAEEEINRMVEFLKNIGAPTCLADIDIEPNEDNAVKILGYIYENMGIMDCGIRERIAKNLKRIM